MFIGVDFGTKIEEIDNRESENISKTVKKSKIMIIKFPGGGSRTQSLRDSHNNRIGFPGGGKTPCKTHRALEFSEREKREVRSEK